MSISKILIANRGEIASRIIKTALAMGIQTVAVYAEDDRNSLHVSNADESYSLGDGSLKETYLNIQKIINIALAANCDAIHPGYGFLSENFLFARECKENNLLFIGPEPSVIQNMGDKSQARNFVKSLGIPILEGFESLIKDLLSKHQINYPVIIKPALGGGGKGMHIVRNRDELLENFKIASREAGNYFADTRVYFEHYIEKARHIEVQIAADTHGNVVHLFERECTVQRNFQKIIEEAPSPSLNDRIREEITSAAVRIAKDSGYTNIGTVEFLLDENNNWYFIEMNTRIQVEHPVTESITGIDLVKLQIELASGHPIPFAQWQVKRKGHSIELRINAESPAKGFRPSSGYVSLYKYPDHCRFDTFISAPYHLSPQYDSLTGKMIVWEENRSKALEKAVKLIKQIHIHGPETNVRFLESVLKSKNFTENDLYTTFCHEYLSLYLKEEEEKNKIQSGIVQVIAFIYLNFRKKAVHPSDIWNEIGYWRTIQNVRVKYKDQILQVRFENKKGRTVYNILGSEYKVSVEEVRPHQLFIEINGKIYQVYHSLAENRKTIIEFDNIALILESPDILHSAVLSAKKSDSGDHTLNNQILAPLHGRVIKINVTEKIKVNRGDVLLVIESMKTENNIIAPKNGLVKSIHVTEGTQVKDNMLLMELE